MIVDKSNPWTSRFSLSLTDNDLKKKIYVPAQQIENLRDISAVQASLMLEQAFKQIVVPSRQILTAVRELLSIGHVYSNYAFPNVNGALARMYADKWEESPFFPVCMSGLAGVGKSQILRIFIRLFFESKTITIQHHANLPLVTGWHLNFHSGIGLNQLLTPHFRAAAKEGSLRGKSIVDISAREAAQQGVAILLADELQFQTQGTASAQIAKHLMSISRIGPPAIYACNFSLLNRLINRPQEERQRLLTKFIMVYPDRSDSDEWRNYLAEIFRVAPEFSRIDMARAVDVIHKYTYGIKRSVVKLLCIAYAVMRKNDEKYVDFRHIEAAYLSREYSVMKEDVENLLAGMLRHSSLRPDLKCPIKDVEYEKELSNVLAHPAASAHKERVSQAALISMLNPDEKAAFKSLTEPQDRPVKKERTKRPAVTLENLIGGAEKFSSKGRGKPK